MHHEFLQTGAADKLEENWCVLWFLYEAASELWSINFPEQFKYNLLELNFLSEHSRTVNFLLSPSRGTMRHVRTLLEDLLNTYCRLCSPSFPPKLLQEESMEQLIAPPKCNENLNTVFRVLMFQIILVGFRIQMKSKHWALITSFNKHTVHAACQSNHTL